MNDNRTRICECGNPKSLRARCCDHCRELDAERTECETRKRVMRRVQHLDGWFTAQDLMVALDIADDTGCYGNMLRRLAREGVVETRGVNSGMEYRMVQGKRRAA